MKLPQLGWDETWAAALHEVRARLQMPALQPARVLRQDRGWLRVALDDEIRLSRAAGKLRHEAQSARELPTIGDWLAVLPSRTGREATTHAVLSRRSLLARRMAGTDDETQPIAANVDVAFLVHGLDQPPHLRRIERALAMIAASGARPVVLLNKLDLSPAPDEALAQVRTVAGGAEVLPVSAERGDGLDAMARHLPRGQTGVLLGPSGAGKSSLANRLLGEAYLATGAVREGDAAGRHTTTRRELLLLPSGALLIDGPGVREFGLVEGELAETFPDVEALALQCRFRDCAHDREPGCAVRAAVESGALDPARFDSFRRLGREIAGQPVSARPPRKGKPTRR